MKLKDYFSLNPDEVHIWSACLSENKIKLPYFTTILSQDEQERASRFRFSRDQKNYIISRGILRTLLAGYLQETPQKIEILYGLWGKPCLSKEKSLSFNLSHSGDYVLYALTQYHEVGIDLEYRDESFELKDMAQSVFSATEYSYWKNLSSEEKVDTFFKRWVSKEAFLKALGKGWLENQDTLVSTRIDSLKQDHNSNSQENDKIAYPYFFESIPGYISALYVEGPPMKLLHYTWAKDFPYRAFLSKSCSLNQAN